MMLFIRFVRESRIALTFFFFCFLFFTFIGFVQAATLSFDNGVAFDGQVSFESTVSLENPESYSIATLNFTLTYDATKITFQSVESKLNLDSAGKLVEVYSPLPGEIRGVVYSYQSNLMPEGPLFDLIFERNPNSSDAITLPVLAELTVSSLYAEEVFIEGNVEEFFLGNSVLGDPANPPSILNTENATNQNTFQLNWSDESASGATSYVVTKMPLASVTPLDYGTGLISYWPLNEASGSALDGQGSNDLVDVNTVIQSDDRPFGIVNGSRFFMAANQNEMTIAKDAQTGLDFGSTMTLSAWVKPNSLGDMTVINNWYEPGVDERSYRLAVREDGSLEGTVSSDGVERVTAKSPAGTIQAGVWQQVAFTVDVNQTNDPFTDSMNNHTVNVGGASFDQSDYAIGEGSANVTNSYMTVPNSPDWDLLANDFTIDFWIKPSSFGDDHKIMAMSNNPNNYWQISFFGGSGENIRFDSKVNGAGYMYIVAQNHGMSANQWHHVAFVRSGTEAFVYINGVDQTNYYGNMTAGTPNFDAPLYIGGSNFGTSFNGKLDEVRFVQGEATYSGNFTPTAHSPGLQNDNTKLFLRFGISDELKLYKDGAEISNVVELEDVEPNLVDSSEPFRIGAGNGGSEYFDGKIADVACWARVLASSELSGLSFGDKSVYEIEETQKTFSYTGEGSYVFFVQSKTETRLLSQYSDSFVLMFDQTPPPPPVVTFPQGFVNNPVFTMTGTTVSEVASIEIVANQGGVSVGSTLLANNNWSSEITIPGDGLYTFSIAAYDEAGNMSDLSYAQVEMDIVAPELIFQTPTESNQAVGEGLVNFIGSVDDLAVSEIVVTRGASQQTFAVSNGNFNFYYQLLPGSNTLHISVSDVAGNQSVETFVFLYTNVLPLNFIPLDNIPAYVDEAVTFQVTIEDQNLIEPNLLSFTLSNLPGSNSSNPAVFDPSTQTFTWTPTQEQAGVYYLDFQVADDHKSDSIQVLLVVQNFYYSDDDLLEIMSLPQDRQVVLLDLNNDGLEDLYQLVYGEDRLYLNEGDGTFVDIANTAGINSTISNGNAAFVVDLNDDGWQDIYVVNSGVNKAFINDQDNTFTDQAVSMGIADGGEGVDVVFFDFDQDGDLDIYLLNNGANVYLKNQGNGQFSDETLLSGLGDPGEAVNVVVADFDQDGMVDIYLVNEGANVLYHNQGNGLFQDVSSNIYGSNDYQGFRSVSRDIDGDFDLDIMLINSTRDVIYRNEGGMVFNEVVLNKQYNAVTHDKYALLIDFDNDSDLDLFVVDENAKLVNGFGNVLFQNEGNGSFFDVTSSSGIV